MRKKLERSNVKIRDPIIIEFLEAQSPKTKETYECFFRKLYQFDKSAKGSRMLEERDQWSRRIFAYQKWLMGSGYSSGYVSACTGSLRGFFSYYKKTLDLSPVDKKKLNRKARRNEDYIYTLDDMRKMSENANQREKYVLLCGLSFGLRAEDFVSSITYGRLRSALARSKEAPIALDPITTQKELGVLAHPFISSDALPIVESILANHPEAKDSDRVFDCESPRLTALLQRLFRKCGLNSYGKEIKFHTLRKLLYNSLSLVGSEQIAKFVIGKMIPNADAAYLNPESNDLREVYAKAMAKFTVSGVNGETKKRVEALEQENIELRQQLTDLNNEVKSLSSNKRKVLVELEDMGLTTADLVTLKEMIKERGKRT